MLEPGERRLFHQTLEPPEGYVLDKAVGTTYTLDLISLLAAPLAFTQFEWEDADGNPTSNPVVLLEALRRHAGQISIFCHAGRLSPPSRPNQLFGFLEQSVIEALPPNREGSFHPKVWVLRYIGEGLPVRYRVVCLSRNLTADCCWDVSVVLEGELKDRKVAIAQNHPLGEFLAALPSLAVRGCPPETLARVNRMSEEVRKVDFEWPEPFHNYFFHHIGLPASKKWPLEKGHDRILVVSPFITPKTLNRLADEGTDNILVSRLEELRCLSAEQLAGFERVYVLSDHAVSRANATDVAGSLQGLHAKFYVIESGRDVSAYFGSANATDAGFSRNVEFLVELYGKRAACGIKVALGEDGEEGETSLFRLLDPYIPPKQGEPRNPIELELEMILERVRQAMATSGVVARATDRSGTPGLELVISADAMSSVPPGAKFKAWPITLPEHAAQFIKQSGVTDYGAVGMAALTPFFAFSIEHRLADVVQESRFVLNLPLEDAPAGRREAILRHVLDDPSKVMRFLQFLLSDPESPLGVDGGGAFGPGSAGVGTDHQAPESLLLEPMLRALRRDPKRLDQVASVVRDLSDSEEGRSRIPAGFATIWEPIWQAREKLRS